MKVLFWVLLVGFGLTGFSAIGNLDAGQSRAWDAILIIVSVFVVATSAGYLFGGLDVVGWFK